VNLICKNDPKKNHAAGLSHKPFEMNDMPLNPNPRFPVTGTTLTTPNQAPQIHENHEFILSRYPILGSREPCELHAMVNNLKI
jgi:hypothetical protein